MNRLKLNHSVVFPFVLNMNRFVVATRNSANHSEPTKAKSVFKPLFDTTDKLFSRSKKKKSDPSDLGSSETNQMKIPTIDSLTQEIKALETFLQSDDVEDFSTFFDQLEQKRSQLAALQSELSPNKQQNNVLSQNISHSKPALNASDYLTHSNSHIQSVAKLLVHYEQLILMGRTFLKFFD